MMTILCALLLALLTVSVNSESESGNTLVTSSYPTPSEVFPHVTDLDEEGRYYLFWKFTKDNITFEVHVRTHGWVGFGLSDNGGMKGADIVVGWIKNERTIFTDRHGEGNSQPVIDKEQNYELLASYEIDEYIVLKFSRELETCDSEDYQIHENTVRVIFAWSDVDPEDEDGFQYHGASQRGAKSVLLLNHKEVPLQEEQAEENLNMKSFTMQQNQVILPANRTYYHCCVMAVPKLEKKHHIIKISPLVQKGNEGVVHHVVAYFCFGELQEDTHGQACWEGGMPENSTDCSQLLYAWAVGGGDFHFPKEAGLSIGDASDPKFLHIEVHYDNPDGRLGIVDNSGLKFYYTDQLREHDSGILVLGNSIWWPLLVLPPGAESFNIDSYCGSACTNNIPTGGIHVFGSFLHTHLTGVSVWTKHIRNGTELPEIARDDHYDFNLQEVRAPKQPVLVLPEDELRTSCVYKTTDRTKPTFMGGGTDDEMCFNFLSYYPKMDLQSCLSQVQAYYPIHQLVMKHAMTGKLHIDPKDSEEKNTYDYLENIVWSADDIKDMQAQLDQSLGYRQTCSMKDQGQGLFGGGETTYEKRSEIVTPHKKVTKCKVLEATNAATNILLGADIILMVAFIPRM